MSRPWTPADLSAPLKVFADCRDAMWSGDNLSSLPNTGEAGGPWTAHAGTVVKGTAVNDIVPLYFNTCSLKTTDSLTLASTTRTIIAMLKFHTNGRNTLFGCNWLDGSNSFVTYLRDSEISHDGRTFVANPSSQLTRFPAATLNVWHSHVERFSSTRSLRHNGEAVTYITNTGTGCNAASGQVHFGQSGTIFANEWLRAEVAVAGISESYLSDEEVEQIEGWMHWTFLGNGDALPSGHPYKSAPPEVEDGDEVIREDLLGAEGILPALVLSQNHILQAEGLSAPAPLLSTRAISLAGDIFRDGLLGAQPLLAERILSQVHSIARADLSGEAGILPALTLSQHHLILRAAAVGTEPLVSTRSLETAGPILREGILGAVPEVAERSLAQEHHMIPADLTIPPAILTSFLLGLRDHPREDLLAAAPLLPTFAISTLPVPNIPPTARRGRIIPRRYHGDEGPNPPTNFVSRNAFRDAARQRGLAFEVTFPAGQGPSEATVAAITRFYILGQFDNSDSVAVRTPLDAERVRQSAGQSPDV